MEIGEKATRAKEWQVEAEKIIENWRQCGYREDSLGEFFMDSMVAAYAAGLAARPSGWRVEIGKDKRKDTWSWTLLKGDEWFFGCSELRARQPDELQKWLAPLIDALHAKVRVVPMEKKGEPQ